MSTYRDEVLDRRVEVQFQVTEQQPQQGFDNDNYGIRENNNNKHEEFFEGTIKEVKIKIVNGKRRSTHRIVFDDGDDQWYDLDDLEQKFAIRWHDIKYYKKKVAAAAAAAAVVATNNIREDSWNHRRQSRDNNDLVINREKKKQKTEPSSVGSSMQRNNNTIHNHNHNRAQQDNDTRQYQRPRHHNDAFFTGQASNDGDNFMSSVDDATVDDTRRQYSSNGVSSPFPSSTPSSNIRTTSNNNANNNSSFRRQGSTNNSNNNNNVRRRGPHVMPKNIDDIIRYMDTLEPGQFYFARQQDSREGCSKTRNKLRNFAKRNPSHPGVRHWVSSSSWRPPNDTVLFELIDLIKTMI